MKKESFFKHRFNNITGQYPAVHLTSCDGRRTPENGLGKYYFLKTRHR